MTWSLKGTYFESCNCEIACPCVFLGAPTEGECTALVGWHIDEGDDGDITLNDLNVALAVHSPGHMATTEWRVAAYVDDRATEEQQGALLKIFSGQAGGHPARLASHIGELLGAAPASIKFEMHSGKYSLKIAGIAEMEFEQIVGQGDGPVTVTGHPLCFSLGFPATVAKSSKFSYRDHGMDWELSEKTGFFSPFVYAENA
jgi:hypothetical protein